jgi:hypothetical protein
MCSSSVRATRPDNVVDRHRMEVDSIKRVASAVGEGAPVVRLVHEHLREDEPDRATNH